MSARGATLVEMKGLDKNITLKIAIPPDAAGYVGFECPSCERYFKVVAASVRNVANHMYCAYCGHHAAPDQFLTAAEIEQAKRTGVNKIAEQLHGQFQDMLVDAFRGSKNVKVTREHHARPHAPPRSNERDVEHEQTCATCALRFGFDGSADFCPQCKSPVLS